MEQTRLLRLFRVLAVLLVLVITIRVAWVSDDALITLRSALNITHNWGPGYNATEAVQPYTHPLWFLLWVWVGAWTNQWILGILALSILFTTVAVWLLVRQAGSLGRLLVVVAFLLLSNAFIDFTSSGLENPLAFFGMALLITLSLRDWNQVEPSVLWSLAVGLTVAAVFLTRMDLLALLAVPLSVLIWTNRSHLKSLVVGAAAAGLPLIIWFAWSWLTYATWLPNTFAAKTNAEISRSEFVVQGMRYLWVSFENDPVTLIGLAVGIGFGVAIGSNVLRSWALGALVYVLYVVWIGGDFMGGRFLAVPFFVAIFVLAATRADERSESESREQFAPLAAAGTTVLMLLGVTFVSGTKSTSLENPQGPRWAVDQNFNAGVADARGLSVESGDSLKGMIDTLSLAYVDPDFVPIGDGTGLARALRNLDKSARNWPINDGAFTNPSEVGVFCGFLGNIGIATGPVTHLIDSCALTDRFLAERPFVPSEPFAWKPGHFHRAIPEGYQEAIATGDPKKLRDTADVFALRTLWDKIR